MLAAAVIAAVLSQPVPGEPAGWNDAEVNTALARLESIRLELVAANVKLAELPTIQDRCTRLYWWGCLGNAIALTCCGWCLYGKWSSRRRNLVRAHRNEV